MTIRIPFSALLGLLVTLAVFSTLWQAVGRTIHVDPRKAVEIVFTPQLADTPIETKAAVRPLPPPRAQAPVLPKIAVNGSPVRERVTIGYVPPTEVAGPLAPQTGVDRDTVPLVRVEPVYPPPALRRGLEGWVKLQFDVSGTGAVMNARVVDARPRGVFDQAALQAVARWRYYPRTEGGQPVERVGLQTVIRFGIED